MADTEESPEGHQLCRHRVRSAGFIARHPMFFVATAAPEGRVNLSPKGLDALRIPEPDRVIWLALTSSGNETAAHIRDSPRLTLMFRAFDGPAEIPAALWSGAAAPPGYNTRGRAFPDLCRNPPDFRSVR